MISFSAFVEELESIEKNAAFMRDVALPWAKSGLRAVANATDPHAVVPQIGAQPLGQTLKSELLGMPANAGKALRALAHPTRAVADGARYTIDGVRNGGKLNAGLLALGTAAAVPLVTAQDDPTGEGMSRAGRAARFTGQQLGGLVGAPYGVGGALAGGAVGDFVGKKVGKGVDKLKGHRSKKKSQGQPTVVSQRMANPANIASLPAVVNQ